MQWLTSLLVALAGMIVLSPSATLAASPTGTVIESISHSVGSETREKLIFKLNTQATPKTFSIKGDNPRLVIDFPNSSYAGKGVIPLAEGKLATTIRTGLHQTPELKTRVVVDLAKQMPVSYTSEYSETDNTFTVELAADSQALPNKEISSVAKQEVATPKAKPTEAAAAAVPAVEKPAAPVFPAQMPEKKAAVTPASQAATVPITPAIALATAQGPQLLDISFDDSSNKGEMVLFHLTAFHPPAVSAVEKDNPRVFCDFIGMELAKGVEESIAAKGKYVERITTTKHSKPDKIRVVLNLSPNRDYDLQQVFFKNDNLFVLIVNELPPEKAAQ